MAKSKKNDSINIDKIEMLKSIKSIPIELRRKKFWICCNSEKAPCGPNGNPVSITDPSNYLSFGEALSAAQDLDCLAGLGFVFTEDNNIVGVDIDHCIDEDGNLSGLAAEVVEVCDSYTEISQSGEGLHIYMRGKLGDKEKYLSKNSKLGLEMYESGRYFIVTGNMLKGSNKKLRVNQDAIDKICEKYMKRDKGNGDNLLEVSRTVLITGDGPTRTDNWVKKKCRAAKNSKKFKGLWDVKYDKVLYPSPSEADLALCSMIAFFTHDPAQIERLVSQSRLGKRKKWRTRPTYRKATIEKALEGSEATYHDQISSPDHESQRPTFFCEFDDTKGKWVINTMKYIAWLEKMGVIYLDFEGTLLVVYSRNNLIQQLDDEGVKIKVMDWLRRQKHDHEIEVIVNMVGRPFSKWALNSMTPKKLKFLEDTENSAFLLFKTTFVEVTADGYEIYSYKRLAEMDRYIWREQKMDRYFKEEPGKSVFREFVANVSSFNEPDKKNKKQKPNKYGYYFRNQYYNAIRSALGEKAHGFKNPKRAVVTIFVDANLDDETQGGTGKSILAKSLRYIKKMKILDGKIIKFSNRFALQNVEVEHQLVVFDDASKKFDFESLFQMITGDFGIEKKGQQQIIIPFEKSPKIIITTNHPVLGEGYSFERRQHVVELSSFYRINDTGEVHGGKRLFDHWDAAEWNRFYQFMIKCIRYYLKNGLKGAASASYAEKKLKNECTPGFVDWADDYLVPGEEYKKDKAYKNFLDFLQLEKNQFSKYVFTTTLQKYARGRKLELNAHKPGNRDRRNGVDYITLTRIKK